MRTALKRILTLALALILLCTFAACGNNPSITLPEESDTEAVTDIYSFVYNGVSFYVNDIMESETTSNTVREKLGEPESYEESNSCAYQGLDKVYTYPGFTIYSYPEKNTDYVLMVVFRDDSVKTPAGIGIGSKAEDAAAAYGVSWDGEDGNLNFISGITCITVSIIGGEVKALQYCYTEG